MKIVICTDKNNGMLFFGKRQSQDKAVREKIFELIGNNRLVMTPYSFEQFEESDNIFVTDSPLSVAGESDFCFIESQITDLNNVEEIIIFNWNRNYPADTVFNIDLKSEGFKKASTENFAGNSHDKITMTVLRRN